MLLWPALTGQALWPPTTRWALILLSNIPCWPEINSSHLARSALQNKPSWDITRRLNLFSFEHNFFSPRNKNSFCLFWTVYRLFFSSFMMYRLMSSPEMKIIKRALISWSGNKTRDSKALPLQVWTGLEDSRRLRLPDYKTIGIWRS
jgi:hypothetical protein